MSTVRKRQGAMMGGVILREKPRDGLKRFLQYCAGEGLDSQWIAELAMQTTYFYSCTKEQRQQLPFPHNLRQRWYQSLEKGEPDFGIYDTEEYLAEAWSCWVTYSRSYLGILSTATLQVGGGLLEDLGTVGRIVDLGCGIGFTTAALQQLFPAAKVTGTNVENSLQIRLARRIGQDYGFEVVSDLCQIQSPVDVVFGSDYFEHFSAPIDHLREIIRRLQPRVFLVANSFGTKSPGHFEHYSVDGEQYSGLEVGRYFNGELRSQGYVKVKTSAWNQRPAYWRRER